MKLATGAGYWNQGPPEGAQEAIIEAEKMGYDSFWTAEAYGSDAITPLAYIAAHTKKIRLGTGVIQLSARTPAMTAMQLGTVDALAGGGRVIGGLGVSGPQIVEGWYGQPWGNPKEKMRDYVTITNQAELDAMIEELTAAGTFAPDSETTSLFPLQADLVGLSFSASPLRAYAARAPS